MTSKINHMNKIHLDRRTRKQLGRRILMLDITKGLIGAVIALPVVYALVCLTLAL